tara:strand:+ start:351 stop:755 length:405 start_codon:yes stop_codon:yes gene_type:complete
VIEFDEYGIQMSAPNTSVLWSGPVLCNVVSSTLIADNRWRYRLAQCGIESGTGGGVRVEGAAGYFDTDTALAFNGCEAPNTSLVASGITVADLPAGFALVAVPNGELVMAWFRFDAANLVGIFNRPGEFEGTCA